MTELLNQPLTAPLAAPAPAVRGDAAVIRFDASQRRLFDDPSRVIVVNWHRQKGKDFTAAAKAVDDAIRTGQDWFIVSLTQRQADATFAKCKRVARAYEAMLGLAAGDDSQWDFEAVDREINQRFLFAAREIRFPGGGRVVSLPGRDPDTLAGLTGNVIFTEFGLFPGGGYDHWGVVFPITTRGFKVIVISTPRGKNTKFYELWSDKETYSVHTCDLQQSVEREGFVLLDQHGNPTTIEQFRRLYNDESKWPREYGCQFTGDLEALIKWAQLLTAAELGADLPFDLLWIEGESGAVMGGAGDFFKAGLARAALPGRLEIGWDVARRGHLSALWVNQAIPAKPKHLRFLVLMHGAEFALQRNVVRAAMDARGWGSGVGCGDATGLGMDSNETLQQLYRDRWEPVNFGGKTKSELGSIGATTYGDRGQSLPAVDGPEKFIHTDLYAIQKQEAGGQDPHGAQRTLKLEETENTLLPQSHCDIAYANLLSLRAGTILAGAPLPPPQKKKPVGW